MPIAQVPNTLGLVPYAKLGRFKEELGMRARQCPRGLNWGLNIRVVQLLRERGWVLGGQALLELSDFMYTAPQ